MPETLTLLSGDLDRAVWAMGGVQVWAVYSGPVTAVTLFLTGGHGSGSQGRGSSWTSEQVCCWSAGWFAKWELTSGGEPRPGLPATVERAVPARELGPRATGGHESPRVWQVAVTDLCLEGPVQAVEIQVESSSLANMCGVHHAVIRRVQVRQPSACRSLCEAGGQDPGVCGALHGGNRPAFPLLSASKCMCPSGDLGGGGLLLSLLAADPRGQPEPL